MSCTDPDQYFYGVAWFRKVLVSRRCKNKLNTFG